jgi:DDE family transposase
VQFRDINEQVKDHQAGDEPVISVDMKTREQLGRLPMAWPEWRPKGKPVEVEEHSFFLRRPGREAGDPVGDLRPHPHRLGQRRDRPRHRRVRGRVDPPLVAITRQHRPPGRDESVDHRRRQWNKIEHRLFSHITANGGDARVRADPGTRRTTGSRSADLALRTVGRG